MTTIAVQQYYVR